MTDFLRFALLGVGAGALYALVGQGLVLVHRGSGVLNFAQGAFAAAGAYLFYSLTQSAGWPSGLATATVVAGAAAFGALFHLLVMGRLAQASAFVKLIATLGMLVAVEQAVIMHWGTDPLVLAPFLPTSSVSFGHGIDVGADRLIILGIVVVISLAGGGWMRFTRTGLAVSAVAEDATAAAALGWSPSRLGALTWALGTGLAALGGILLAPISGLDPSTLTLVVVPALGAALIGGFSSFGLTLLGGLAIGIAQSLTSFYVSAPGWSSAVPFVVIVIVLVLRGDALPVRGAVIERLPRVGSGIVRAPVVVPAVGLAVVLALAVLPANWTDALSTSLEFTLVLGSIVVVTGYAGQLSLAQFALAGVGALVAARVAVAGGPYWLALLAGSLACVPVGVAVGLAALRTRGPALAVATLGLGLVIQSLPLSDQAWTGGLNGLQVGNIKLFGVDVDPIAHSGRYAAVLTLVVAAVLVTVANLRRGNIGRQLLAIRSNERAAAALGANVAWLKLYAFAIAAGIAGLAGGFFAFRTNLLTFDNFTTFQSVSAIALVVVGGVGYALGALIGGLYAAGGVFVIVVSQLFGGDIGNALLLATGLLTMLVVVRAPDGLAGLIPASRRRPPAAHAPRPAARFPAAPAARLQIEQLSVRYGAVTAVRELSLEVDPGTVVGLIGPNGAGKTTLIDAVSGFVPCSCKGIWLGEHRLERLGAHRRAIAGLGRTFQSNELFEDLCIRDNLLVASRRPARHEWLTAGVRVPAAPLGGAEELVVDVLELGSVLDAYPDELSLADRRLAAIARSVVRWPSVLLLDEPGAGLGQAQARELGALLRRLALEARIGILLVEHRVELVLGYSDRVVAMDFGVQIADGPPDRVRRHPAVLAAYLGVEPTAEVLG
jgi:ABC-type branched-subunit amino acid transport system ATPase component/ABC-type branched-subunit amino acid transport system permease subunit